MLVSTHNTNTIAVREITSAAQTAHKIDDILKGVRNRDIERKK